MENSFRVDVSEIKTMRDCGRKWSISSRNYYHTKPRVENPNLRFGTIFHEGLAGLYLSKGDLETIQRVIDSRVEELGDPDLGRTLRCMLEGYADNVLPADLARYEVLDIEHKFQFGLPEEVVGDDEWARELMVCGSIDLILLDRERGEIVGFEHKSCKSFRTLFYNSIDEQPRTYFIALGRYIERYNEYWGTNYKNGGIYVNEVRKLKTRFEHNRIDATIYSEQECLSFLMGLKRTAEKIHSAKVQYDNRLLPPEPGYMKCNICDFRSTCEHYGYKSPKLEEILEEFSEELQVREYDHLDEKIQRSGETADAVPPEYAVE